MNKDDDEILTETVSINKTDELTRYMAALGFRPKEPISSDTLEFSKLYTDPNGRTARAVAVIEKDIVGLEPKAPAYFTLTIQTSVRATEEDVKTRAFAFCREDLLRILAHYAEPEDRAEAEVFPCQNCGMISADFVVGEGVKMCHACGRKKGLI